MEPRRGLGRASTLHPRAVRAGDHPWAGVPAWEAITVQATAHRLPPVEPC